MSSELSVIMAVYNGSRFLEAAIQSVLSQTYSEFEFLIIDDGSTDESPQILAEFQSKDPRIVVITQSNCGISNSLNRALASAKNELVAHIDADDRALPNWLESQMGFLKAHPESTVVSSYAYFINASGKRFGKSGNPIDVEKGRRELDPRQFLEVIHSTVIMRRKDIIAVGGYRQITAEDRDLWGRVVTSGMMIRCNSEALVEYRLHGTSETTRKLDNKQKFARRGIDLNVVRRLQGKPEFTPEEVEAWYRAQSLGTKVREFRRRTALTHFQQASRHYSEGHWLKFIRAFGIAAAIRPVYVLSRAFKKISF